MMGINAVKQLVVLVGIIGLAPMTIGCGSGKSSGDQEQVTAEDVRQELRQAGETATRFTEQQRREFIETTQSRLDAIDERIEDLDGRVENATDEVKAATREQIRALQEQAVSARAKLKELSGESEAAWGDMQDGMAAALAELDEAYERAAARFES